MKRFVQLLRILLLCSVALNCRAVDLRSLSQIERELIPATEADIESFLEPSSLAPALHRHLKENAQNAALLYELAIQSRYPHLGALCVAGLRLKSPELAVKAALGRLSCATNIGTYCFLPYLLTLTNSLPAEAFSGAVSGVSLLDPQDHGNMSIVLGQLPAASLGEWILSTNRPVGSLSFEALVLERLLDPKEKLPAGSRSRLMKRLESLRICPGLPRAVYLLRGDIEEAAVPPLFENVIVDERVDSVMKHLLARKYAKILKGVVVIERLAISPGERMKLRNLIDKHSR